MRAVSAAPAPALAPRRAPAGRSPRARVARRSTRALATATSTESSSTEASAKASSGDPEADNTVTVKSAEGVRLVRDEASGEFGLEFLLRCERPEDVDVWVPAALVADDVKRDYERNWWTCCRAGDLPVVESMLRGGGAALVAARDDDGRTGLHFACGVGSIECVNAILGAGAEVDAADKDAFTPLHIAAGYLHEKIVESLVLAGANPELQDSTGRSPLDLVETLKLNTPATTVTFARRSVLESIAKTLEKFVFEEVPPKAILDARVAQDGDGKEFLVEWLDEFEPQWVGQRDVSDDIIDDYERGLEYAKKARTFEPPTIAGPEDASAEGGSPGAKKKKKKKGAAAARRRRLVVWEDGSLPSWELADA